MARGGGNKKKFNIVPIHQDEIFCLRAPQGHSGRNPIDLSLQDNVLILDNFFEYTYHIGCAINFALRHKFRSDIGRPTFEQKTEYSFCLRIL